MFVAAAKPAVAERKNYDRTYISFRDYIRSGKFIVMLGLLVLAVFAGGKIRKGLDAKKAAKQEDN